MREPAGGRCADGRDGAGAPQPGTQRRHELKPSPKEQRHPAPAQLPPAKAAPRLCEALGLLTCQDDVGDVAVAGVAELRRVLQAAVAAGEAHHCCLGVVKRGAGAVQAVGTNGVFYHVKLFELKTKAQRNCYFQPSGKAAEITYRAQGWEGV